MDVETSLGELRGIGPKKLAYLQNLGLFTVYDVLTHYPRAYEDRSATEDIANLVEGEMVNVLVVVHSVRERVTARGLSLLTVEAQDATGTLELVWFNQPYLKDKFEPGTCLFITGKVGYAYGSWERWAISQIKHWEILPAGAQTPPQMILPIYATTENLPQKLFYTMLDFIFKQGISLPETLPPEVLTDYNLLPRVEALQKIHQPQSMADVHRARERLGFEELYLMQCGLLHLRQQAQEGQCAARHLSAGKLSRLALQKLPFTLTTDQQTVWQEICQDMEKNVPMRRLLQGDVGSGKTALAFLALMKTVENGFQGAFMAPTEILARQHYQKFQSLLEGTEVRLLLLTGKLTPKERAEAYQKICTQAVDIVIGTHALIQDKVAFKNLGLAVTDEQHRFGIEQRAALEQKGKLTPDLLVMTATPIPRTMTLTVYGDLDVSRIAHLPPGRKPVRTYLRTQAKSSAIYTFVRKEMQKGRQAYVVCPRIEKREDDGLTSAKEMYAKLKKKWPQEHIGLLHGRMRAEEKEQTMAAFQAGEIRLLVSTTVIEVGVDVPKATVMVIENAERFGLAQLHQLRGRVGRGSQVSYCILIAGETSEATHTRLALMERTTDGFLLAEEDLRLRGPGQFFGRGQHGLPDLKIADALHDIETLKRARRAAMDTMGDTKRLQAALQALAWAYGGDFARIAEV